MIGQLATASELPNPLFIYQRQHHMMPGFVSLLPQRLRILRFENMKLVQLLRKLVYVDSKIDGTGVYSRISITYCTFIFYRKKNMRYLFILS